MGGGSTVEPGAVLGPREQILLVSQPQRLPMWARHGESVSTG